jgi:tetratricopeptide (TPR) repeat protein
MRPPTSPAFVAEDPLLGQRLGGRYRLGAVLGRGGMGTVYRATREDTGDEVAVKVLRHELASAPDARARFEREARAVGRLDHPGCVTVTDFGDDPEGGHYYLVMELAPGEPLSRRLARGPLSPVAAALVADGVLAALAHAHAHGIVHRDLKPENIMVGPLGEHGGVVKILDFGVARLDGEPEGGRGATLPGLVLGTPHYLSPEQCLGEPGDARSDLYAVGVLLYEMVTGRRPFDAATPRELYAQHIGRDPQPPSQLAPSDIAPALDVLIMRALAKSPSERFASAEEMRNALHRACPEVADGSAPLDQAPWTSPGWASPITRGRRTWDRLVERFRALPRRTRLISSAVALAIALLGVSLVVGRACRESPGPAGLHRAAATASEASLAGVRDALARGDLAGARARAEALVRDNPDDPRAYLVLGHALFASREKERGLAAYREVARLDRALATADAELWANLRATFADKKHGEAAFTLAEGLGPEVAPRLHELAESTRDKKLKARALAAAQAAERAGAARP